MPPSRSKTRQKKAGKEKAFNCERNSAGDSKIRCGKQREGKSRGQVKGKESLPGQGDSLGEEPLKIQRLGRPRESKENDHKKLFRRKRARRRSDKSESGLGRKHGVSRLEGKKGKACKQREMASGQESEDSSDKEGKAITNRKKQSFKKWCGKRPGVGETGTELGAVKAITEQGAEGSFQKQNLAEKAQNPRGRHRGNQDSKETSEQKSGSQSQGSTAQEKGERTGKKQVEKLARIVITESEDENILETSGNSCSDSSSEGHGTHEMDTKESVVGSTSSSEEKSSSAEEKSSSSEEDGNSETEAVLKDPPASEGKGYKELADESKEASVEPEREQVTTEEKIESEAEGIEFTGLEAEQKMRKPDNVLRQPERAPAESSEADDQLSTSGLQVKSVKNRENIELEGKYTRK